MCYDVIITGCGPAGSSSAIHLLDLNPDLKGQILILEKAQFPRDKLCAGGLTYYGESILNDLKLELDEPCGGIKIPSVSINSMHIRFGTQSLSVSIKDKPVFRVFLRRWFDHWFMNHARDRGAIIHEGEEVLEIRSDAEKIKIITDKREYKARVLIGADGARSKIRKSISEKNEYNRSRLIELEMNRSSLIEFDINRSPLNELETSRISESISQFKEGSALFDFTDMRKNLQGYFWIFPSRSDTEALINYGVFDSCVHSKRARLKNCLTENLIEYNLPRTLMQSHPLNRFKWSFNPASHRVILVGDAAGVDSFLGEGISFSLAYGRIAARTVDKALRSNDFSFRSYRRMIMQDKIGRFLLTRQAVAWILYSIPGKWLVGFIWRFFAPIAIQLLTPGKVIIKKLPKVRFQNDHTLP